MSASSFLICEARVSVDIFDAQALCILGNPTSHALSYRLMWRIAGYIWLTPDRFRFQRLRRRVKGIDDACLSCNRSGCLLGQDIEDMVEVQRSDGSPGLYQ